MARPHKSEQLADIAELACDDRIVHFEAVRSARDRLLSADDLEAVSAIFSALADPTRLRIVAALSVGELCVCDLAAAVGQSKSAVSHQLRSMRALRVVRSRRDGRRVYYALDDEHIIALYEQAVAHSRHQSTT